jgi:WD40 repeat protein/uncharacterized protein YoxC
VEFVNESNVVFPVAHHLGVYQLEQRKMDFFQPTRNVRSIQCFHLSPNREFIAVVEKVTVLSGTASKGSNSSSNAHHVHHHGHNAATLQLCIYKTNTHTRVKCIPLHASNTNATATSSPISNVNGNSAVSLSIVSMSFSNDNKFIALLEDAPAHSLNYWKISNGKLVASSKCPSRGSRVLINPNNPNFISVSGPMILKYWLWTNNDFKIGNLLSQAREQEHFVDHVWIRDLLIAVTEHGTVFTFRPSQEHQSADLMHSYKCHQPSYIRLECIASHSKGFVLGGSMGFFSIYEFNQDDSKDPFSFVRSVIVGEVGFECIAISPNFETVVASTKTQELLTFNMGSIDVIQDDKLEYRQLMKNGQHSGPIIQVDTCIQREFVASCGQDKTFRLWNYETRTCDLLYQFSEEPIALSMHPAGFQVLVAFKERVRLFNILQDSLRQLKELPLKSCRVVKFSTGGHLFACASGITINTFRTYTCEPVHIFSGHISAVRSLTWSRDDIFIFSAGNDGAVYRWNIISGTRSEDMQHVVKTCQYAALVVDEKDPRVVVAGGSDGKLREIISGDETKAYDLPGSLHGLLVTATSMILAKDNKHLFVGTNVGCLLVYSWPLAREPLYECYAHCEPITQLRLTEDLEQLLSSSDDGSIFVHQNYFAHDNVAPFSSRADVEDNQELKEKRKPILTDAILLSREDVEEKNSALQDIQVRYDQMKADVEFALHRKENEWVERLRSVKEETDALVTQERIRFEDLEHRYQHALRKHGEELAQKEANHVKMAQELENQYEHKLAREIGRYDALSEELERTRHRCEALIESQDVQHRTTINSERKAAQSRAKDQNEVIKRLHDDLKYNHVKFEEVLSQQESEYEHELQKLRIEYEKQLEAERQNTALKQGQLSATNTKLESLKKKMQEFKISSHARDVLLSTEKAKNAKLEATLQNYERHFEQCKSNLIEKDKEMTQLKSSNRILENFRSVLDHRVDELVQEKNPMEHHMRQLEDQMKDIQEELVDEFKLKHAIQQDVESKDAKIKMLFHEVKSLRQNALKKEYAMSEMTREFTRIAQITNPKDLEIAVKDAYRTFVFGEAVRKKPNAKALLASFNQHLEENISPTSTSPSPQKKNSTVKTTAAPSTSSNTSINKISQVKANQKSNVGPTSSGGSQSQTQRPSTSAAATIGYDCKEAVNESVKQMEFMSKTIATLKTALENTQAKADRIRRDSVAEGSFLIEECNKLRKENKNLVMKLKELENLLSSGNAAACAAAAAALNSGPEGCHSPQRNISTTSNGKRNVLAASGSCPQMLTVSVDQEPPASTNSFVSPFKLRPIRVSSTSNKKQLHVSPVKIIQANNNSFPLARLEADRSKTAANGGINLNINFSDSEDSHH